ncbi:hypothetical protein ACMV_13800 [Acidiphilium multivorum AIU301]|uniref:Uncharacterized protein n=1 Tax=Acidiphilium multivorum (strain DSM 11245 / JCM 8867 / NBRC 100883 / AIU 301) TaxID=926570 RepID=F0IY67_ACIMA|nr:hypothetical protein ACMV_13800 [Acidiphilium multivorum AIU301]
MHDRPRNDNMTRNPQGDDDSAPAPPLLARNILRRPRPGRRPGSARPPSEGHAGCRRLCPASLPQRRALRDLRQFPRRRRRLPAGARRGGAGRLLQFLHPAPPPVLAPPPSGADWGGPRRRDGPQGSGWRPASSVCAWQTGSG